MSRTILVATDGTPAALGALRLARSMEEGKEVRIEVLGVVEPVPVFDAGFLVALPEMELYESRQDALRHEIENQVEEITGSRTRWATRVEAGLPGPRIVRWAEERSADTILLGLGRHRPVDRVFGTETALQVIRVSHLPVLAVPEDAGNLPCSAVLGVDFSHFSQQATSAALGLMRPPWEAHLVHVMSGMEFLPTMSQAWRADYEEELRERLHLLVSDLEVPRGCAVHVHLLEGEPAHELLGFAEDKDADLLVAGSHGHSFVGRLLMGSVSTRLIRGAHVPVLVIPPGDRTKEVFAGEETESGTPHPWVQEMKEFSRANLGRRTTLELNDPELGAQECGKNFPLWGVDYDPRRDRLNIMLGRSGTIDGHLTHSISAPQDVRVEPDAEGNAQALQVRLRQGQIVLKIHRD
jgi:nucleotide-binding universal stress UspA family protein